MTPSKLKKWIRETERDGRRILMQSDYGEGETWEAVPEELIEEAEAAIRYTKRLKQH